MSKKIPVSGLIECCETMMREGWGYIWGTAGVLWTAERQKNLEKTYGPDDPNRGMSVRYGSRWIGHMVADCSGVNVYIWKKYGLTIAHGSNSIRKKYCGQTQSTPRPGYAAFKVRNGDDYYHIGTVAADNLTVYESKGTQSGFVMSAASSWACFAPYNDVDYDATETEHTEEQGGDQVIWQGVVETESGRLNVRSGPGTEYPRIGSLPKGESVDVFAEQGDWAYIAGDGLQGYVSKLYLKNVDKPAEPEPVKPEEPEAPDTGSWAVIIPFVSEIAARRYAETMKNAVLVKYEKPPDA